MIRVTTDWRASYADPIRVSVGDKVTLTGREDIWQGHCWLWAVARDGREGWVPDDLVASGLATRDYDARELDVASGDLVDAITRSHGWVLCRDAAGQVGWVPASNFSNVADADRSPADR